MKPAAICPAPPAPRCSCWTTAIRRSLPGRYTSASGVGVTGSGTLVVAKLPGKPGAMLMQAQKTPSGDSPLLSFCDKDGEYCDELLAGGSWMVVSVYDREELSASDEAEIAGFCAGFNGSVRPLVLLSGGSIDGIEPYTSDRRTLMTLNRSNGGATLISSGTVITKWPRRSYPSPEAVEEILAQDPVEAVMQENAPKRMKLQGFLLYLFAVLLLL